ncbi:hypothetical protein Aperf_G00000012818 [Anoplocephala perfoliata]
MALHTSTLGGLGQVNGPLEAAGGGSADPSQASPMAVSVSSAQPQQPPAGFMKYAPTPGPFGPPPPTTGDPYTNGGGGGSGGMVAYGEEGGGQPLPPPGISPNPPPANTMQMQQFAQPPTNQRIVQLPTIIDPKLRVPPVSLSYMRTVFNIVLLSSSTVLDNRRPSEDLQLRYLAVDKRSTCVGGHSDHWTCVSSTDLPAALQCDVNMVGQVIQCLKKSILSDHTSSLITAFISPDRYPDEAVAARKSEISISDRKANARIKAGLLFFGIVPKLVAAFVEESRIFLFRSPIHLDSDSKYGWFDYCYMQHWNSAGPGGPSAMTAQQMQQQQQLQAQANFDEAIMTNGGVVVVSSGPPLNASPTMSNYANNSVGDRRLLASPMGTPMQPGVSYAPRFASAPIYHHNPAGVNPSLQQPSPTTPGYMQIPQSHHDPTCMNPAFTGATTMNGQRIYMPGPQGPLPGPRMVRGASPGMGFSYFQFSEGAPPIAICSPGVPAGFQPMPAAPTGLLQPDQQPGPSTGRKSNEASGGTSTTTKKKRTKTTKARTTPARGGNGRGVGGTNAAPKVVTIVPSSVGGAMPPVGCPAALGAPQHPPQIMSGGPGGMVISGGVPQPGSLWGAAPRPQTQPGGVPIITNGSMMTPMTSLPVPTQMISQLTNPCGPPQQQQQHPQQPQRVMAGPPQNIPSHLPLNPHQQQQQQHSGVPPVIAQAMGTQPAPPQHQQQPPPQQQLVSTLPIPPDPSLERLVCPITNGTLVRPTPLLIDEEQSRQSPNNPQIRTLEFDISKNHLDTIVERNDLDIVVASHLFNEPLQVCHWPVEALQIRFNGTILQLDRSATPDGSPAHKVCGIKALCHPTKNTLEVFLLPSNRLCQPGCSLADHRFTVFMAHMPAVNMVLDGVVRNASSDAFSLLERIVNSWRQSQSGGGKLSNVPPPNMPVVAEISLICPTFNTRIKVPGRMAECQHISVFDMEAFLHREAVWSRLRCPICGNGGSAGLESLVVDSVLVRLIDQIPLHLNVVKVRSDGYWSLCEPYYWQLPPEVDQWQPIMGPYTQMFTHALKIGPVLVKSQQQPIMVNGLESISRRSFGTIASPSTAQSEQSQNQQRIPENPPSQLVSYATQVGNMPSPKKEASLGETKAGETDSDLSAENKRVLGMVTEAPVSSMPDLRTGIERTHPPPKSLPSTPTFPKTSPSESKPSSSCSNSGQLVRKRSRGESFGEEISPSSPKMSKAAVLSAKVEDETLWGFDGLKDLSGLADPEVKAFIFSLTE